MTVQKGIVPTTLFQPLRHEACGMRHAACLHTLRSAASFVEMWQVRIRHVEQLHNATCSWSLWVYILGRHASYNIHLSFSFLLPAVYEQYIHAAYMLVLLQDSLCWVVLTGCNMLLPASWYHQPRWCYEGLLVCSKISNQYKHQNLNIATTAPESIIHYSVEKSDG